LIYLLEDDRRGPIVRDRLGVWIEGGHALLTSTIALMEILVHPLKQGDRERVLSYRSALDDLLGGPIIEVDEKVAVQAAEYRARFGWKTPDALQVACAVSRGCELFYTNDRRLRSMPISVLDVDA
jgi:predicted nucleic acid-binding protein